VVDSNAVIASLQASQAELIATVAKLNREVDTLRHYEYTTRHVLTNVLSTQQREFNKLFSEAHRFIDPSQQHPLHTDYTHGCLCVRCQSHPNKPKASNSV
jgi:hypothetical protein